LLITFQTKQELIVQNRTKLIIFILITKTENMAKVQKMKSRLTQISNVKYEKGLFEAHKTNTPLDGLFSIDGGVP